MESRVIRARCAESLKTPAGVRAFIYARSENAIFVELHDTRLGGCLSSEVLISLAEAEIFAAELDRAISEARLALAALKSATVSAKDGV
jgi:hypothetical protein